ncbi:MAG: hypothetical protein K8H88_01750 [Sandaracinaceae bacterium]|nr:hypothetical protein [Sandaracinaceae bacterium]
MNDAKNIDLNFGEAASSIFVRLLEDGDRAVGVLTGMPFVYEVVWSKEDGYEPYDPARHAGRKPRVRVAMNFFDLADGKMRIVVGGSRWWKSVRSIRTELPLDRWAFEIVRRGGPGDPRTTYTVLPYARLGTSMRMRVITTPLHDLEKALAPRAVADRMALLPPPPADDATAAALRIVERFERAAQSVSRELLEQLRALARKDAA